MQSFEVNRETLQENIDQNRNDFFPPPNMDPIVTLVRLSYVNRRPRNKMVTGYAILRYYVSLRAQIINCGEPNVVGRVTSEVWKSATVDEKSDYVNLSNQVNALIAGRNRR